jgi:hypothetical protein
VYHALDLSGGGDSGGGGGGTSGGGGGGGTSGGGNGPTPVIKYDSATDSNDLFTDLIGGHASIGVTPPVGSSLTIDRVDWSSSGSPVMYAGQHTPSISDHGFVNDGYDLSTKHTGGLDFYWGASGGTEAITASVTYKDTTGNLSYASNTAYVTLIAPPVTADITYLLGTHVTTEIVNVNGVDVTKKYLRYGTEPPTASDLAGMDWSVTSDYGSTNVVQTIQAADAYEYNDAYIEYFLATTDANGNLVSPTPLVDANGSNVFYGNPSHDSPAIHLEFGSTDANYNIAFKDTVMFQPSGGIWVPAASWTWIVWATATNSAPGEPLGNWTSTDVNAPSKGLFVSDSQWPTWIDAGANYTAPIVFPR